MYTYTCIHGIVEDDGIESFRAVMWTTCFFVLVVMFGYRVVFWDQMLRAVVQAKPQELQELALGRNNRCVLPSLLCWSCLFLPFWGRVINDKYLV